MENLIILLSLFSYQMLASTLTMDERSSYYKVYGVKLLCYFQIFVWIMHSRDEQRYQILHLSSQIWDGND